MHAVGYHLIAIAVAAYAVVSGFRRGFIGQLAPLLGLAFGVVCAHVFGRPAAEAVATAMPWLGDSVSGPFACSLLGASAVFGAVYALSLTAAPLLRSVMAVVPAGILNAIFGALFMLLQQMTLLSLAFNLILCVSPQSSLLKCVTDSDGNIVEGVVMLAPEMFGCMSAAELAHAIQLREARKISCNFGDRRRVIVKQTADGSQAICTARCGATAAGCEVTKNHTAQQYA